MPLFAKRHEENEKLRAEVARLASLPLAELAAEVMTKGFGPGAPAGDGAWAGLSTIAGALTSAEGSFLDGELLAEHYSLVAEGAQILEHSGLVRFDISSEGGIVHWMWTSTRYGAAALQQGAVLRVLQGGQL